MRRVLLTVVSVALVSCSDSGMMGDNSGTGAGGDPASGAGTMGGTRPGSKPSEQGGAGGSGGGGGATGGSGVIDAAAGVRDGGAAGGPGGTGGAGGGAGAGGNGGGGMATDASSARDAGANACRSSTECAANEFCDVPCDVRIGATGVCRVKPTLCTREYVPVCGCDGRTYGNDCTRMAAGVGLRSRSACPSSDGGQARVCGGFAGFICEGKDEFCEYPVGTCGLNDISGMCQAKGSGICPAIYQPVCGCDGKTYGNDCTRQHAGIAKKSSGACPTP